MLLEITRRYIFDRTGWNARNYIRNNIVVIVWTSAVNQFEEVIPILPPLWLAPFLHVLHRALCEVLVQMLNLCQGLSNVVDGVP